MSNNLDMNSMDEWGFDEFSQYFNSNRNFLRGSKQFRNVQNHLNEIQKLQSEKINEITCEKMFEVFADLKNTCISYQLNQQSENPEKEWECFGVVQNLSNLCKNHAFNQLRDSKISKEQEGKTWESLKTLPPAALETKKSVGGIANERFFMEHGDKKGFFTPKTFVLSESEAYDNMLTEVQNPEHKRILTGLKDDLIMYCAPVCEASQLGVSEYAALQVETYHEMNQMESQKDKESFGKLFSDHYSEMFMMREDFRRSYPKEKIGNPQEERKYIEDYINKKTYNSNSEKNAEIRNLFLENKERMLDYVKKEAPDITGEKASEIQLDASILSIAAQNKTNKGKESASFALLYDPEAKKMALNSMKKVQAHNLMQDRSLAGLKVNDELTGRNTLSSRIADELGVGNLLAHSQDMTAKIDGKEIKGCFMEFAEGIDLRNCHGEDLKNLSEMQLTNTPGFMKDMCNLEMLDYICVQSDRHAGNIFLKRDENNRPCGLQGIDNDMCLTAKSPDELTGRNLSMKQPPLKNLHFMSEDMAKRIQKLKPKDLERLVGDKLSKEEFDALQQRVDALKDHIKNNVFLVKNDEDWSLDNYDNLIKPANLRWIGKRSKAKALFDKARKELEDGLNPDITDGPKHQNASILAEVNKAKKRYQKELEEKEKVSQKAAPEAQKEAPQPEKQSPESEKKGQCMVDNRSKETFWKKGKTGNGAVQTNLNDLANETEAPEPEKQNSETEMKGQGMTDNRSKETLAKKNHIVQNPKFGTKSKEVDPSKTAAKIEDLTEDGTVKLKTYSDGKKIKIYTSSDGQVIKTDTYAADGDKRNRMSLTDIIKNMKDHNEVAQRDGDEREAARKEQKEEIKRQNEKMNPIKDEMGNIREPGKQEKNNKPKVDKGVQNNGQREKDNSFKAELDKSKERKTNLKLGAHRENMGMKNEHTKQNAVKNGREM